MTDTTLLLVTWNNEDLLEKCLKTLYNTFNNYPFKLVIVDNNSNNKVKDIINKYTDKYPINVIYNNENKNYVYALKQALKEVDTKYTCTIQTDMEFPNDDWLADLRYEYEEDNMLFIRQRNDKQEVYGFCFFINTCIYTSIGVDTDYVLCCEDWDFIRRFIESGRKIVRSNSDNFVIHHTLVIRHKRNNTSDIEKKDQETYRKKWGSVKPPINYLKHVPLNENQLSSKIYRMYKDAINPDKYPDIYEHLPTLRGYANLCKHVTEFGARSGGSTKALASSWANVFVTYDIAVQPVIKDICLNRNKEGLEARVYEQNIIEDGFEIEQTDMLFIDTLHDYEQLKQELKQHSYRVNKYIIMHDTVSFGNKNESGRNSNKGLMPAINEFLASNNEWKILEHHKNNNGLMVLTRK